MALESTTSSYHWPSGSREKEGSSGGDQESVVAQESVFVCGMGAGGSEWRDVDSSLA